jgi:hypothetical protein
MLLHDHMLLCPACTMPHALLQNAALDISWAAPAAGSCAVSTYVVSATAVGSSVPTQSTSTTTTSATLLGLTNGVPYTVQVTAFNAVGF